ncbi:MAG TPA: EFR1 family ferrodoxin [Spirochaetota bacterium]|nr:EFR1 family ferrodoxin [Spirochaetota bacterium]
MNNRFGFFYFSGTGNTKKSVSLLKEKLEKYGNLIKCYEIDELLKNSENIDFGVFDKILIGYPIYSFNVPKIVYDFVKKLPKVTKKDTIIFETAGDFISVNYGACFELKNKLKNKGFIVNYKTIIAMPSNFLIQYPDDFSKQLYEASIKKIDIIADEIEKGVERKIKFVLWQKFVSLMGKMEQSGATFYGMALTNTKDCTKCNLCVSKCPVNNLYFDGDRLKGKSKCIFCMRCAYICPKKAVTSKFMSNVILKEGYDIDHIINHIPEKPYVTKETKKGYYKHFYDYIYSDKIY